MKTSAGNKDYRQSKLQLPSMQNWKEPTPTFREEAKARVAVACGWGRLIFCQTFASPEDIVRELRKERLGERDLAFYVHDPHIVLAAAPMEVFLDPSHTFRIWFENYRQSPLPNHMVTVRRLKTKRDIEAANQILISRNMIPLDPKVALQKRNSRVCINLVAQNSRTGEIVGFVTGVDHKQAFNDPENGSSLWSLSVSPYCSIPGVGEALTRYLIEYFIARGRAFMDLSVLHKNRQAMALYRKLNFERVPVFCIKRKNEYNEPLYTNPPSPGKLNPYAMIIINEAQRRGIRVEVLDEELAYFRLSSAGKSVICRESLTDLTTAIAMSRCMDKRLTFRTLKRAGLKVPQQIPYTGMPEAEAFLTKYETIVVKPACGEQGHGVKVGIQTKKALKQAIQELRAEGTDIILEEFAPGYDVRIIVIDYRFVAAAVRRPPEILGNGQDSIRTLITKLSRRRSAATGGESQIPLDAETERCLAERKYSLDDILPEGKSLTVRKTANVHTGGTITDITNQVSDDIKNVAETAAKVLEIPVVGFDFMMPELTGKKYRIIEANERPGLANHEPQPTAERFVDLLFPLTRSELNLEGSR